MKKFHIAIAAFAILLANPAGAAELSPLPAPAGPGSSLPRLVKDSHGSVYLSWVAEEGDSSSLLYSKLTNDVWQAPELISSGEDWFINWAHFPSLVVNEDTMAAHWLQLNPEGFYNYDVKAAFYSPDAGGWSRAIAVNTDGVSAEHGFVSMLPLTEGKTFIAWLDGRYTRPQTAETIEAVPGYSAEGGAMSLRAGIFDRTGKTLEEWELDARVCDCCQTGAALAASGPVVVYRDRSEGEIRDTYITRLIGGRWSEPEAVYSDGWKIEGCPVNGPAVAADGQRVAVAWFSGKDNLPVVKLSLSEDGGGSFSPPVTVANETVIGRVAVAYLESGRIALSWMDTREESGRLMLALYSPIGDLIDLIEIAETTPSPASGFPSITSLGEDVFVAWTEVADSSRVKVTRVRF